LRYELSERGFFSEINNMINAFNYAIKKGYDFQLETGRSPLYFSKGKYEHYLRKFWTDSLPCSSYSKIHHCHGIDQMFQRIRRDRMSFQQKRQLTLQIFQLQPAIAKRVETIIAQLGLASIYACFHIRRGDKVGETGRRYREARRFEAGRYLNRTSIKCLYVCTDDYRSFRDLKGIVTPTHQCVTLCPPHDTGHSTHNRNRDKQSFSEYEVVRLLSEIVLASRSKVFVGTYSSNLSRFVALIHQNPSACYSLDVGWHPL